METQRAPLADELALSGLACHAWQNNLKLNSCTESAMTQQQFTEKFSATARQYKTARGRENHITSLVIQAFEEHEAAQSLHVKALRDRGRRKRELRRLGGFFGSGIKVPVKKKAKLVSKYNASHDSALEIHHRTNFRTRPSAHLLSDFTRRCIKSAEWIADQFNSEPDFEWSCAVLPLCKGLENEIHEKMLSPLRQASAGESLKHDCDDKDFARVAKYCAGRTKTPPEMGSFAWFLGTAINSKSRRERSQLLRIFFHLIAAMANQSWLLSTNGLLLAINEVTQRFRNPAAHLETLTRIHYQECQEFLIGENGVLWALIEATRQSPQPTPSRFDDQ
jgi:hypothetical protein